MRSLSSGSSPSVNARVTAVRKAQLVRLAEMDGVKTSDLVRDAVNDYLKSRMKDGVVADNLLRVMNQVMAGKA